MTERYVTPNPKPEKRARKPRKPIARVHVGGKRSRTVRRIKRVKASRKSCLALVSQLARRRDKTCQALGHPIGKSIHALCSGPLQGAHGFGKKAYPAEQFTPWNCIGICASAHFQFHKHEACWEMFLRKRWGSELYETRWQQASRTVKHDYAAVEAELYRLIGLLG